MITREEEIINKLNDIRLSRGISVYRLAELTGINQSTLANTFSRRTVPSIVNLELMCDAMGLTPAQFLSKDESCELLSNEERVLITDFRKLPKDVKQNVANLIKSVINND